MLDKIALVKALFFLDYFCWALLICNYIFVTAHIMFKWAQIAQKEICMRERGKQKALDQKREVHHQLDSPFSKTYLQIK